MYGAAADTNPMRMSGTPGQTFSHWACPAKKIMVCTLGDGGSGYPNLILFQVWPNKNVFFCI